MWRIMQIEENVIHLGLQPWMAANAFFWFTLHALGGRAWKRPWLMVYCPPMQRVPHPRGGGTRVWWSPTNLLSGRIITRRKTSNHSRHQTPPLLLLAYLFPCKKVSGSEDKNIFSFTAHEQTIVRKVICDENELSADDVMISDLSNVGKK